MSSKRRTLYGQHLAYSAFAALAGLPVGCLLVGVMMMLYGLLSEPAGTDAFFTFAFFSLFVAMVAMLVGVLPVFLYAIPIYAWLSQRGWANIATALCIGLAPGVAISAFDAVEAALPMIFGASVALCTHFVAKRRLAKLHVRSEHDPSLPSPGHDAT